MTTTAFEVACTGLGAIALDELDRRAALHTRRDRKYLVREDVLTLVLAGLPERFAALEIDGRRAFRYETVYFDTPGLDAYLAAARGRPNRWKVRTRTYHQVRRCVLEVKLRDRRQRTVKVRCDHPIASPLRLDDSDRSFLAGFAELTDVVDALVPSLTTDFIRSTLFDPATESRTTIDTGLRCRAIGGAEVAYDGVALVETKSLGPPTALDRLLWSEHQRPVRMSKYATGLATLRPDLPANAWHTTLRRLADGP